MGELAWEKLGQARQEYRWRKIKDFSAPELQPYLDKFLNFDNGFYVDIGANDGRSFSNTYKLEYSRGWTGLLVEPILQKHFDSKKYRNGKNNIFVYGGCVSDEYDRDILKLHYSNLMTTPSFDDDGKAHHWASEGRKFLGNAESILPIWAPAFTLKSKLREFRINTIDFLSIDVEGGELQVLEGIDWDDTRINFILIETTSDSRSVELLKSQGFELVVDLGNNQFFKKQ